MTPQELAAEVENVIAECRERVEGVGAQQYWTPGQPQRFETMDLDGLFAFAEEEIRDLVVYAVMLRIRLRRLRDRLAPADDNTTRIDRDRAQRLLDMVRATTNPINDEPHRREYRRAKDALRGGDLDDLPDYPS